MSIPKNIRVKHGKIPSSPGVYLFRDKKGSVVYVGKATNLKSRVSSYWKGANTYSSIPRNRGMASRAIEEMLHEVARIDWITTDSVIEALILEANLIRKHMPRYNVKEKDDKSFLYVVVTKEQWPKVMLMRENELGRPSTQRTRAELGAGQASSGNKIFYSLSGAQRSRSVQYIKVFGPYTSARAIRAALDLIRKWFAWSTCRPWTAANSIEHRAKGKRKWDTLGSKPYALRPKPCFDYHIGRCPGVCIGAITRSEYMKNIRNVILMLEGKKGRAMNNVEREMQRAAKEERFEEAEQLKRKLFALRHILDVAVLTRESLFPERSAAKSKGYIKEGLRQAQAINPYGRIEGYDISNISGTSAVGSMVVFQDGEPAKSEYKRFKIKTVRGINDVAMMREVLGRRFSTRHYVPRSNNKTFILRVQRSGVEKQSFEPVEKSWPLPDLIVIDGGWGQVNAAREVVDDIRRSNLRLQRRLDLTKIPIVGIAKGFKRKQDQPIFDNNNQELARIVESYKDLLLRVRDEAHRFAVVYHRKLRSRRLST